MIGGMLAGLPRPRLLFTANTPSRQGFENFFATWRLGGVTADAVS
jgi:hypothetical protein